MLSQGFLFLAVACFIFGSSPAQRCPGIRRDLVLLLDSSGSVSERDFEIAKKFLASFISELDVSETSYQVAVVRFSDGVRPEAKLGRYNGKKGDLMKRVLGIKHNGGGTQTGNAIKYVLEKILNRNNRDDAPDQILILTDGKSDDPSLTVTQIQAARERNVQMISVGVGKNVSDTELRSLASRAELMFKVDSYAELTNIQAQLVAYSCGVTTTTPTTTESTTTTTTTTTEATTTSITTEESTPFIDISDVTDILRSFFNSTTDDCVPVYHQDVDSEMINFGLREKRDMLDSASGKWKKTLGLTVGLFALTAVATGLIIVGVRRFRRTRKKHYLETL